MKTQRKPKLKVAKSVVPIAAPTRRRRQSEILEAAAKVFAERGYHGASTQDIADILGIRQASLYYYFPSKEIALERVCLKGVEGFFESASEVAAKKIRPSEKVRGLVEAHLAPLLDRPDFVRTFLNERQYLPPASRKKVGKLSRAYENVIEKVIREGVKSGEFRQGADARLLTLALLGMCKSVATWLGNESQYTVSDVSTEYALILLNGIASNHR